MKKNITKLPFKAISSKELPPYTQDEEKANMITHCIGGVFALAALITCVIFAAWHKNTVGIVTGIIYGISMMLVYVVSGLYHGLDAGKFFEHKVKLRKLDHCDIYGLIVGSFAPMALTGLREVNPVLAWVSFGIVAVTSLVGIVFTAIDYTRFRVVSYSAYFVAGWSVLITLKMMKQAFSEEFIVLLLVGGVVYTLGMVFFVLEQKNVRFSHSVFHCFILAGSVIHFAAILKYCM